MKIFVLFALEIVTPPRRSRLSLGIPVSQSVLPPKSRKLLPLLLNLWTR